MQTQTCYHCGSTQFIEGHIVLDCPRCGGNGPFKDPPVGCAGVPLGIDISNIKREFGWFHKLSKYYVKPVYDPNAITFNFPL